MNNDKPTVKMVERVIAVLRSLSQAGPMGLSLTQIAAATGLHKTTAHRLVTALVETELVFQDLEARSYRLGSLAVMLGWSASEQHLAGSARPVLDRLAAKSGDTVFATLREGLAAVCVARSVGPYPIRTLTLDVGDRRPLGVGAGSLALLSFLSDSEVQEINQRNERWLADFQGFHSSDLSVLVARTRRAGYALNEGRIVPGMNAIGVPVFGPDGRPVAALSLAAIRDRIGPERLPELVDLLREEAEILANILYPANIAAE